MLPRKTKRRRKIKNTGQCRVGRVTLLNRFSRKGLTQKEKFYEVCTHLWFGQARNMILLERNTEMLEMMIPKKDHSAKALCSFSTWNKGRSKINHMTNAIYFYDSKEDEKYHRQWKMDGHKQWNNCMGSFNSFLFSYIEYLYFPYPPSSP